MTRTSDRDVFYASDITKYVKEPVSGDYIFGQDISKQESTGKGILAQEPSNTDITYGFDISGESEADIKIPRDVFLKAERGGHMNSEVVSFYIDTSPLTFDERQYYADYIEKLERELTDVLRDVSNDTSLGDGTPIMHMAIGADASIESFNIMVDNFQTEYKDEGEVRELVEVISDILGV